MTSRRLTWMGVAVAAALTLARLEAQQAQDLPADKLEISAFAVNMSNIGTGSNAVVAITVNQWSTDAERERLIDTMLTKGSDALLRELQKAPVKGRFRVPGSPAGPAPPGARSRHPLRTADAAAGRRPADYPGDGSLHRHREARNQPRSIDYPFTLIEIRADKDGKGEGKMSVATKIKFDKKKNVIELENYATEPVRLNNVEVKVKS